MVQYWQLVNVDRSETIHPGPSELIGLFGFGDTKAILHLLTVPNLKNVLAPEKELRRTRVYNFFCRLVALPQEVFDAIVANVSDPMSIISLALTCSYLWRVLLPQVREAICTIQAPWAGHRLIFVFYLAQGAPQSFLDFQSRQYEVGENPLYEIDTLAPRPPPIYELPFSDQSDARLFLRLLPTLRRHPGYKGSGVLRNLTKRQYVLDSKLAESGRRYSLGDAVVIRTQWAGDSSEVLGTSDWVGDRFDIRSIQDFPVGWTDVSDETIGLLDNTPGEDFGEGYTFDDLRTWVE